MQQSQQLNSIDVDALRDRLSEHVDVLARVIGDRNLLTKYTALESAARYVESTFAQIGYQTSAQVYEIAGKEVRNIEVESRGTNNAQEILVIGAHYDSVPGSPAANDNASGVAGVLELARHFRTIATSRTLRFVAFVNEEPPYFHTELMGSLVYARRCRKQRENIVGMISLETIGFYSDAPGSQKYPLLLRPFFPSRGNFIAFVGDRSARRFVKRVGKLFRRHSDFPMQRAAAPNFIPGVGWSDHWSFSQVGYPALMVTDTAPFRYRYYHTPQDTPEKLDYQRMGRVVAGMGNVVNELASGDEA
jgi:Zn-dependent M28 family amino/carboxypeptidase